MNKSSIPIWFEGSNEIDCNIKNIKSLFKNHAELFVEITKLMPGMTSVELLDQGSDYVTIQTNEGLMKRTNISKHLEDESVVLEFDEEYQAGKMVTKTHYFDKFTISNNKVNHLTVLSGVDASGFLGFLYKKLGKSNIGNAVMNSYKTYFEMKN